MPDLAADGGVGHPRGGPCQHEPRQHVDLELLKLLGRGRDPMLPQVTHRRQHQLKPLTFTSGAKRTISMNLFREYRTLFTKTGMPHLRGNTLARGKQPLSV